MTSGWFPASVAVLVLTGGCPSGSGSEPEAPDIISVECTNHYTELAEATTRVALKRELLLFDPLVRSLRVTVAEPGRGKTWFNLLNRRQRTIVSLAMWKEYDGTWTAQTWRQCSRS